MSSWLKEAAEARLREFVATAVERAGGARQLAHDLAELGVRGRGGREELNYKAVETWQRGARHPSAVAVFAMAGRYQIDLNEYVRPRPDREAPTSTDRVDDLDRRLGRVENTVMNLAIHVQAPHLLGEPTPQPQEPPEAVERGG